MTQTVSFKEKFKSGFALFKWELKSCIRTLIVFSLIAGVFITIVLTLCAMGGFSRESNDSYDYEQVKEAIMVFQYVAAYFVFILNAVFTIVYTVRIYSYLHNKRKADLYGSMPISRRTFYISKTVSAYLLSIIPAMFFFGLICIITVCFGVPVVEDIAMLYVKLLVGAIACISFYGLLAVCCGTTINSILSFIAINFAYPITTLYIKGTLKAFFWGIPTSQYNNSFIMKALNPMAAYDGANIIYWMIFTAVCLFLGIWLVKKRRAECAQTSFAFYLPCYIVELLIAFIIGMFVGVIFGSINVFFNGFLGFIFGFILGSAPALIVTHLILYRGFSKLWRSAIVYGGLAVTVIALMAVCNFDLLGYNSYIPAEEDIKSAGLIDLDNCYCSKTKGALGLADMASDDYDDSENIKTVTNFHSSIVKSSKKPSCEKFRSVWINMLLGSISSEYTENSYCIAYRLNNGALKYRYYHSPTSLETYSGYEDPKLEIAEEITDSETYYINYNPIMNTSTDEINRLNILVHDTTSDKDYVEAVIPIEGEGEKSKKAEEDRKRILEAYRKDVKAVGRHSGDDEPVGKVRVYFDLPDYSSGNLLDRFIALMSSDTGEYFDGNIYSDYTNTLEVLKDLGVLKPDNTFNENGEYYVDAVERAHRKNVVMR